MGRSSEYPGAYAPGLLRAVSRDLGRRSLGPVGALPFVGADLWRAWELSWLDAEGKPAIAVAEIEVPADSPNLIESKSLKLYLGSLNNHRLASVDALQSLLCRDLTAIAGAPVTLRVVPVSSFKELQPVDLRGERLDELQLCGPLSDDVDPTLLSLVSGASSVDTALVSDLFRSRCPITGQPDWASVRIAYRGKAIAREPLLRYLLSYRDHGGFHEACVERIFMDLRERCEPRQLMVQACFTRRGGIDINPWRSSEACAPPMPRPWRS
ncbi:MAG TPA: NADPH-dependent 7-cyano-7-deazaguanine reductase QueF [Nannocystis exedens]|nr:NADPH-dependent 7-cyano-7-deazaguanine reductase QueF [Nannocystis exedens]